MKLICKLDKFKKALSVCEKITTKQGPLKILNNVLIRTQKNEVIFLATNLEIGVTTKIRAKIEKEGEIMVPVKTLVNFINNLPLNNENIEIISENQTLKIKGQKSNTIIKGFLGEEFPLIPKKKGEFILKIKQSDIEEIISKVSKCTAINDVRLELTGINCIFSKDSLFFAATDSFRLAESKIYLNDDSIENQDEYDVFIKKNKNVILPLSTILELGRIIQTNDNMEDDIYISIEDGQIFFKIGETYLVSKLIDGNYPQYKHIMPEKYQTRVVGDKNEIQRMIKMASVFSDNKNQEISLKIDSKDKKIIIKGMSGEIGENVSEVNLEVQGVSLDIILNARYILDGMNSIKTSKVALLFNDGFSPMALKEIDEDKGLVLDDYVYIIMPIKK